MIFTTENLHGTSVRAFPAVGALLVLMGDSDAVETTRCLEPLRPNLKGSPRHREPWRSAGNPRFQCWFLMGKSDLRNRGLLRREIMDLIWGSSIIICANQRETPQIQHMVKNHASCVIPHYKMEYQRVPRIHHFMVCFILVDRTFSGALCERNSPNTQWKSVMEMEHRALLTCLPNEHVVFPVPCLTTDQTVTSLKWCLCIEVTRSKFEHLMMPMGD